MNPHKSPLRKLLFASAIAACFEVLSASSLYAAKTCNPHDFGAKGDGKTKDTVALQPAIDACGAQVAVRYALKRERM